MSLILTDLSHHDNWQQFEDKEQLQVFTLLDTARDAGVTNMMGASYLLVDHFNLNRKVAREALWSWIKYEENKSSVRKLLSD